MNRNRLRAALATGAFTATLTVVGVSLGNAAQGAVTVCPATTRPWTISMTINPYSEWRFTDGRNPVDLGANCRYTGTLTQYNGQGIVDQVTGTQTFKKTELNPDGTILKPTFVS